MKITKTESGVCLCLTDGEVNEMTKKKSKKDEKPTEPTEPIEVPEEVVAEPIEEPVAEPEETPEPTESPYDIVKTARGFHIFRHDVELTQFKTKAEAKAWIARRC